MRHARIEVDGQAVEGTVDGDVITLPDGRTVATAGAVWLPAGPPAVEDRRDAPELPLAHGGVRDGAPARGARLLPQAAVVGERPPRAGGAARGAAAS